MIRPRILRRDHHRCYLCGQHGEQVDHIRPLSEHGAPTDYTNLACICANCHTHKTRAEIARSNTRRARKH